MKNLRKIKGDASEREFYRKKNLSSSSIIVFSKKEKFKNLFVYNGINTILNANKILAPKLYKENFSKGFIEIQDFGDQTIFKILKKKNSNKYFYYKKIIKILNRIQLIKVRKVKIFKKKNFSIPLYEKKILLQEASLFSKWYVKKNLTKKKRSKFFKKFNKIIVKLSSALSLKNNTFVHRDFHVSNLMMFKNHIAVIDSQDALIGNKAYDLASLIDDVRLKTSKSLKDKLFRFYLNNQKKLDKKKFQNDFEILSVMRNLKIIGIFTRLALRDGKKNYLKLVPHAWSLISLRISNNTIFDDLKKLIQDNFRGKI